MRRYSILVLTGIALVALGGEFRLNLLRADDKKSEEKKPEPVIVPFEMLKTGHMAVMIKVNGKGPYRVIFDTGAPMSLLSTKLAKEAEVKTEAKGFVEEIQEKLFGIAPGKAKSLQVGDAKLEH